MGPRLSRLHAAGADPGFGFGGKCSPPPFFGLEMRILVHSPAHLSICFCTVIRPGPANLLYAE